MSRPKRTRPIHGKYWNETPRMVHEGRIISIRSRISQIQLIDHGPAKTIRSLDTEPRTGSIADIDKLSLGEIERGRVDGDESYSNRDADADSGRRDRGQ